MLDRQAESLGWGLLAERLRADASLEAHLLIMVAITVVLAISADSVTGSHHPG